MEEFTCSVQWWCNFQIENSYFSMKKISEMVKNIQRLNTLWKIGEQKWITEALKTFVFCCLGKNFIVLDKKRFRTSFWTLEIIISNILSCHITLIILESLVNIAQWELGWPHMNLWYFEDNGKCQISGSILRQNTERYYNKKK